MIFDRYSIECLQTEVEGQLSSKEENFRVTQKKNIKKSWETSFIKGFVSFRVVLFNKNYKLNKIPTNQKLSEIVEFLSDGKLASRLEIQETMGLQKSYTSDLIAELKKLEIIGSEGRGLGTRYYLIRD
ncbi:hypothetical protein [Staphylococcus schweitzeri]|uniref:hypothetical protein n=1 Tax=Staphylococcus schweitzeri TaxID=1654388 RepID=UPI000502D4F8|nr:hypothetical protein [Staphylococcus schweitzeri]CDR54873.1 hypothetical protein ERS140266_02263 [Staphylococcus schweitzeri]CDR61968.1 hypothetical protein ERS140239_01811 [Staphylococcus schweitzeri]VEE66667.1 Uncharacterised protein [Staphylococcus schweitzeri]